MCVAVMLSENLSVWDFS